MDQSGGHPRRAAAGGGGGLRGWFPKKAERGVVPPGQHSGGLPSTGRVLIASNRGPVSFAVGEDGSLVARRGAGGLISGLSSVMDHADVLWVCAALSDADRTAARSAPDGRLDAELTPGKSAVRMLDLPAATFQRAYNSVANSTLWFRSQE